MYDGRTGISQLMDFDGANYVDDFAKWCISRLIARRSLRRCRRRRCITRVSAAADRPARRSGSAHAKYSVSRHVVIRP